MNIVYGMVWVKLEFFLFPLFYLSIYLLDKKKIKNLQETVKPLDKIHKAMSTVYDHKFIAILSIKIDSVIKMQRQNIQKYLVCQN